MPAADERLGSGGRAGLRSANGIPGRVWMLIIIVFFDDYDQDNYD